MVWVYSFLAIFASLALFSHLLKFRLALDWSSQSGVSLSAGFSLLGWTRSYLLNPSPGMEARPSDRTKSGQSEPATVFPGDSVQVSGQGGFMAVPMAVRHRMARFRRRFRRAGVKFLLDMQVWRSLLGYLARSGRRVLVVLHPKLEYLHVGTTDVLFLGGFAAFWSMIQGLFPALSGQVEYHFVERPSSASLRMACGFSFLNLVIFASALLFTFPWIPLWGHFLTSWRNPRLNRWQRRLLLF